VEVKGENFEADRAKRAALGARVKGVNEKGGFGAWRHDVILEPARILDCIAAHSL
jgi:type III restriction enzyme